MWRAFDATGRLAYPDFVETVVRILPMYWVRVLGGTLFVAGMVMAFVNILMTWRARPAVYEESSDEALPLARLRRPRHRARRFPSTARSRTPGTR